MVQKVNDYEREKVVNQNSEAGKVAFGLRKHAVRRTLKATEAATPE